MAKKGKKKANKCAVNASSNSNLTKKLPLPDPPPVPKPRASQETPRKRKPLQPTLDSQSSRQTAATESTTKRMNYKYGAEESAERLQRLGFDRRVTDLSPCEFFKEWSKTATIEAHKPLPEGSNMGPAGPRKRDITIAPLLLGSEFFVDNFYRLHNMMPAPKAEKPGDGKTGSHQNRDTKINDKNQKSYRVRQNEYNAEQRPSIQNVVKPDSIGSEGDGIRSYSTAVQPRRLNLVPTKDPKRYFPEKEGLRGLLRIQELNVTVLEHIFATGFHNLTALGTTSIRWLGPVRRLIKIFDCTGSVYDDQGTHSPIFVALVPEYNIGDFWRARDRDPCGLFIYNFIKSWWNDAILEESKSLMLIARISNKSPYAPAVGQDTAELIKHIELDENLFATRRVVSGYADEIYKPDIQREGLGLKNMLVHLYQQRKTVTCVHFDRVPLFDRRLLAIILHGCPKITSVSINSCPLIHVGDLLPILDEISEINRRREAEGSPQITTLDFGPAYERGMPFHREGYSATYGLVWNPIRSDVAQAGLYAILLKAFLKTHAMGLQTLFDKDCALMRFLLRLPTGPLGIPIFLDACYRILDFSTKSAKADNLKMKMAVFDMLQIVRLGIYDEMNPRTLMHWFNNEMMGDTKYCPSCGYKMMTSFFYPLNHTSEERPCYGCQLQVALDNQTHHLREKRMGCIKTLFPEHEPQDIGPEASVSRNPKSPHHTPVLSLQSMSMPNDKEPTYKLDAAGDIVLTGKTRRSRQKFRSTSLRNLSSLEDLCKNDEKAQSRWKKFFGECEQVDIFRRAIWILYDQIDMGTLVYEGSLQETLMKYAPCGRPDHYHEIQLPGQGLATSRIHAQSKKIHLELVEAGEMPGVSAGALVSGEELRQFEQDQQNDFW